MSSLTMVVGVHQARVVLLAHQASVVVHQVLVRAVLVVVQAVVLHSAVVQVALVVVRQARQLNLEFT